MTERRHRSVSQLNQYAKCPYSYKLQRIDKAWQRPAAWTAQGSAVHEAIEAWERSGRTMTLEEMQQVYRESYRKYINAACSVTPNFEWWFASGPYKADKDIPRRYELGLEMCGKYIDWATGHPEEVIWVAEDGTPGIELGFDIDLDGVLVRGFIDAILEVDGKLVVRDHKTGKQPGDDFQLGVYAVAVAEQFGVEQPEKGDYWMGRTGKATYPYDLTDWPRDAVTEKFKETDAKIEAGEFPARPSEDNCRFCDVSYACEFAAG